MCNVLQQLPLNIVWFEFCHYSLYFIFLFLSFMLSANYMHDIRQACFHKPSPSLNIAVGDPLVDRKVVVMTHQLWNIYK
uniref:Uncharacterized protein n=1 Tax=Pundamilia nyererei TaxID=303518 RepID=A0A3B4GD82_9CICH